MRIEIDAKMCQGHLRCYAMAPELFDVDDIGHGIPPDREITGEEEESAARLAAASCPENAITIIE
jgi:ferredoxin